MNIRKHFFTFSGLILCLFQLSLAQEFAPRPEIINVAQRCLENSTVNLEYLSNAILTAKGYYPDCEIILGKSLWKSIVISFFQCDLNANEELKVRDSKGTELSFIGPSHWSGERTFIFNGPVVIHYASNATYTSVDTFKFKFVFTETHDFMCTKDEFECTNTHCIPKYLVCDRHNNCGDRSDEIDCNRICTTDEFKCANTKCIPKYKLCNNRNDCGDFSDEKDCNDNCEIRQQYKCKNSRCISNLYICDGKNDCGDWSDETDCYLPCDGNKFRCNNNKCIDSWAVCDGHDNCGDRSDEKNCRTCLSSEFRCSNRKCIQKFLLCNGRDDCGDFSDEKGCSSTHNLKEDVNQYRETRILALPLILGSVAIGIVLILLITLSICFCVSMAKRSKQPNNTASSVVQQPSSSEAQQPAPSSLMRRMRQSFRSQGQPSAPPLEMVTASESAPHEWQRAPSIMGRIRQSFRSRHQPTIQQPDTNTASDARPENSDRPAIYPNLPAGADNPEFKAEE